MIYDTIEKIEARLREGAGSLPAAHREELLALLGTLKGEVGELSKTNADQARSIVGFAEVSTHEVMREQKNPRLMEPALKGLSLSVEGFEESHPRLVQIVNALANALANMGI